MTRDEVGTPSVGHDVVMVTGCLLDVRHDPACSPLAVTAQNALGVGTSARPPMAITEPRQQEKPYAVMVYFLNCAFACSSCRSAHLSWT